MRGARSMGVSLELDATAMEMGAERAKETGGATTGETKLHDKQRGGAVRAPARKGVSARQRERERGAEASTTGELQEGRPRERARWGRTERWPRRGSRRGRQATGRRPSWDSKAPWEMDAGRSSRRGGEARDARNSMVRCAQMSRSRGDAAVGGLRLLKVLKNMI
jgi:hypothetical protein